MNKSFIGKSESSKYVVWNRIARKRVYGTQSDTRQGAFLALKAKLGGEAYMTRYVILSLEQNAAMYERAAKRRAENECARAKAKERARLKIRKRGD